MIPERAIAGPTALEGAVGELGAAGGAMVRDSDVTEPYDRFARFSKLLERWARQNWCDPLPLRIGGLKMMAATPMV